MQQWLEISLYPFLSKCDNIWLKIYFNVERGVLLLHVARDDELFLGNSKVFKKYVELGEEQSN